MTHKVKQSTTMGRPCRCAHRHQMIRGQETALRRKSHQASIQPTFFSHHLINFLLLLLLLARILSFFYFPIPSIMSPSPSRRCRRRRRRRPAKLVFKGPPSEPLLGSAGTLAWPPGWVKKVFKRRGGKYKGQRKISTGLVPRRSFV